MQPSIRATLLAASLAVTGTAAADAEVAGSVGHARVNDTSEASGPLVGLHAAYDFDGPGLFGRVEGHYLRGNLNREYDQGDNDTAPTAGAGIAGLIGLRLDNGVGLYTGLGYRQFDAEFDDSLDGYLTASTPSQRGEHLSSLKTVYVPIGLESDGRLDGGWEVTTRLELAMPLATQEDVDLGPNVGGGSATFERTGGVGGRLELAFQHGKLLIAPYARAFDLPEGDTETINGQAVSPHAHRSSVVGLRVGLVF